jgi:hypothetical protein
MSAFLILLLRKGTTDDRYSKMDKISVADSRELRNSLTAEQEKNSIY